MHHLNRKDIIYWTSFGALAIAAIVMGYMILKPDLTKWLPDRPSAESAPSPSLEDKDRAAILNTPAQDAPTSTKNDYFTLIQKFAVETDAVDLTGCEAAPIVARLKEGSMVKFTNKDTVPRMLQVNPKHVYTIPPQGSLSIKADFGFGQGWYGYGCNDSRRAVGVFWVTL